MNTFFTTSFPETSVRAAWRQRNNQLRARQLQDYNDSLYEVVSDRILARRAEVYNALVNAINAATVTSSVSIPLWTYHTAHYKDSWKERHTPMGTAFYATEDMEVKLRRKGYHWLVGTVEHGFTPTSHCVYNDTERDGYVGHWDHVWGWGHHPRSVHEVVRLTDFRQRIALLFGDDRYRVSYNVVARKVLRRPLDVVVEKVELLLHYHPRGLYDRARKALLDAKLKYERHEAVADSWRVPYVWTGVPGHRETVEEEQVRPAEPPGFSNRTPTPPPAPAQPPPLARRTNGGGLHSPHWSGDSTPVLATRTVGGGLKPEDFAEVSQRLSFEEAPSSIHEYSGPDALERCARDAVAGWMAESLEQPKPPCHCEYHHPDPPECTRCGLPHPEPMFLYRSEADGTISANPLPEGYCPPTVE